MQQAYLQQVLLQRLYMQFLQSNDFVLKQGLEHPDPRFRFAAALATAKKNRPFHDELIHLLEDDDGYVQQAARSALHMLTKGQDFGPLPGASCLQISTSVEAWKDYFKKR